MHRSIQGSPYPAGRVITSYYLKTALPFFAGKPRSYKGTTIPVGARLAREGALQLYG